MPRPRELDLLALWLAARGASGTPAFTFWELLEAFAAADEADRWTLDWSQLRPWGAVPSRATRLVAACRRVVRGRGELPEDGTFLRFIQTGERLRQLVALDGELP